MRGRRLVNEAIQVGAGLAGCDDAHDLSPEIENQMVRKSVRLSINPQKAFEIRKIMRLINQLCWDVDQTLPGIIVGQSPTYHAIRFGVSGLFEEQTFKLQSE
jgi:hypothetical protein